MQKKNKAHMSLKGVGLRIGDKTILQQIDFELEQGRTLLIIGESGSGKTILSKLIIGAQPQSAELSGEILFNQQNLLNFNQKQYFEYRGSHIAYIAQNPMSVFNPMMTIKAHAVELFKSKLGLDSSEVEATMIEALGGFNFKEPAQVLQKYPFQLSGGMLQRVMFAMMLALKPQFLIADEPSSALDDDNTNIVIEALAETKRRGIGIIIITHNYQLVKILADKILIIKDGEQIEYGEAEAVLANPTSAYAKQLLAPRVLRRYHEEKTYVSSK